MNDATNQGRKKELSCSHGGELNSAQLLRLSVLPRNKKEWASPACPFPSATRSFGNYSYYEYQLRLPRGFTTPAVMAMQQAMLVTASAAATWIAASFYFNEKNTSKETKEPKSGTARQQDQVRADYAATVTNKDQVGCCEPTVCFLFDASFISLTVTLPLILRTKIVMLPISFFSTEAPWDTPMKNLN